MLAPGQEPARSPIHGLRSAATRLVGLTPVCLAVACGGSTRSAEPAADPAATPPAADTLAPSVSIVGPQPDEVIGGGVELRAEAIDDVGVAGVQFLLDGALLGPGVLQAASGTTWVLAWDSTSAPDGLHELAVEAQDLFGNRTLVAGHTLDVLNHAVTLDQLAFASFLGGSSKDSPRDVATDAHGNVYVVGGTESPDFPTTPGAFDGDFNGTNDVFAAKLGPDGELVWSTLIGGPGYDRAYAVEVGLDGSLFLAGRAGDGFPTTPGSLQPAFGGDVAPSQSYGAQDGFVLKLAADGSQLLWSTFVGAEDGSNIRDLALDPAGAVYLAADAGFDHPSPHVPSTALQAEIRGERDALVMKLAPDGSRVEWATYLGGSGVDGGAGSIRVDDAGSARYLGHTRSGDLPATSGVFQPSPGGDSDLFVARFAPDGGSLVYLTYLGGTRQEFSETHGLSLDANGAVYVTATTLSADLVRALGTLPPPFQASHAGSGGPSTGLQTNYSGDGFVAKLSADGASLQGFTYFGGSLGDGLEGSAIDRFGNVFISGATYSVDLPIGTGGFQPHSGTGTDGFVACFSPDLSTLLYATYLGGTDFDFCRALALSPKGEILGTGITFSADMPTTIGALDDVYEGSSDGLVFKID